MRFLAISDIHNNMSSVRKLRAYETNRFDAVVVAGDIGDEIASPFFDVLATFLCPVLYVYGNWDNTLSYEATFSSSAQLLHMNSVEIQGFHFSGFSGCPTHWGSNPVLRELITNVEHQHKGVVSLLSEARKARLRVKESIVQQHKDALEQLSSKTQDRQKQSYKRKVMSLERKHTMALKKVERTGGAIQRCKEYRQYRNALVKARDSALLLNREMLFKAVRNMGIDLHRAILVTHERLSRLEQDVPGTLLHLFGHRHGFKHTVFKGTDYVNVSVLDRLLGVAPVTQSNCPSDACRVVNAGTYAVIELLPGRRVCVTREELPFQSDRWRPLPFAVIGNPLIPEELQFGEYS